MQPQSGDAAIVNELFHHNQHLDSEWSSVVYDEAGHLIKLSLQEDHHGKPSDEPGVLVFPAHFHRLAHLRELYIYAPLGPFPMSICHLASLQAFVLSEQRPAPVFPSEFAQLRTLRYLGLGGNEWEDHFPSVIWQLRQLRALDLSWNYMTELPPEIGQLTELRFLYLQANHFRLLPEEMTQLLFLEDLKIWSHWLEPSSQASAQFQKLHEQIPALLRRFHFSDHYPCACCGYLTIEGPYDVCPVCYWEADDMQNVFPSSATGANRCCLIEARLNFARVGVSDDRLLDKARAPLPEEIPDEENRVPHMHFSKEGAEPTL